jgi:hypothetical protein
MVGPRTDIGRRFNQSRWAALLLAGLLMLCVGIFVLFLHPFGGPDHDSEVRGDPYTVGQLLLSLAGAPDEETKRKIWLSERAQEEKKQLQKDVDAGRDSEAFVFISKPFPKKIEHAFSIYSPAFERFPPLEFESYAYLALSNLALKADRGKVSLDPSNNRCLLTFPNGIDGGDVIAIFVRPQCKNKVGLADMDQATFIWRFQ